MCIFLYILWIQDLKIVNYFPKDMEYIMEFVEGVLNS
jgi:hypothetical protein